MKKNNSFSVDFNYALSENITLHLTANVQLEHSEPHYIISDFHFKHNPNGSALLNDISIVAIKNKNNIVWVHADSRKETLLSAAIGEAIKKIHAVEVSNE